MARRRVRGSDCTIVLQWVLFARLLMVEVFENCFVYLENLTDLEESIWGEVYGA